MTFDDYKQRFEIFSKIDTPAKLAICEKQYQKHIEYIAYHNHFEPFEETKSPSDVGAIYERNLHSILGFDKIVSNQILFLIQPSFKAERMLIFEKTENRYDLTIVTLEESYWIKYRDNTISTAKKHVSSVQISKSIGDQVFALVEQSIIDAKKPNPGYFVLDGTVFKLAKIIDGVRRNVTKHSPEEDSKTGRIIKLLSTFIELTNVNSSPNINNEIVSIINLIDSQKGFEPNEA